MSRQKTTENGSLDRSYRLNKARKFAVALGLAFVASHSSIMLKATTIASFEDPNVFQDWAVVNDSVMGGVSQSAFEQTSDGNLLFFGKLSLANNGGFVSIRNRASKLNLGEATGIELRVRGDGRTYNLDLRSSRQQMAGSFRASFTTVENEWKAVFLPLNQFVAQSFGRSLRSAKLAPSTITSIGFTLSDKKPGRFRLEVEYVKSFEDVSRNESAKEPSLSPANDLVEQPLRLIELAIVKGVPLFNQGSPAACAAIYEVACTGLIAMPGTPAPAVEMLRRALNEIDATSNDTQKAWILRDVLDKTLALLRQ